MRSGRLREIISIRKSTWSTQTTLGEPVMAITTLASNVWAEVNPAEGAEQFMDDQRKVIDRGVVTIRYISTLTESMSIYYNSNSYDIKGIVNVRNENRSLRITVERVH